MADNLGISAHFRPDDLKRVYIPESLATEREIKNMQHHLAKNDLTNKIINNNIK